MAKAPAKGLITTTVTGAEEIERDLAGFSFRKFKAPIDSVMKGGVRQLQNYPAPPPASGRYQRTGDLGAGWTYTASITGQGITAQVENAVTYARWVQDADSQAAVHVGRWVTVQDVSPPLEDALVEAIEAEIDRQLDTK